MSQKSVILHLSPSRQPVRCKYSSPSQTRVMHRPSVIIIIKVIAHNVWSSSAAIRIHRRRRRQTPINGCSITTESERRSSIFLHVCLRIVLIHLQRQQVEQCPHHDGRRWRYQRIPSKTTTTPMTTQRSLNCPTAD